MVDASGSFTKVLGPYCSCESLAVPHFEDFRLLLQRTVARSPQQCALKPNEVSQIAFRSKLLMFFAQTRPQYVDRLCVAVRQNMQICGFDFEKSNQLEQFTDLLRNDKPDEKQKLQDELAPPAENAKPSTASPASVTAAAPAATVAVTSTGGQSTGEKADKNTSSLSQARFSLASQFAPLDRAFLCSQDQLDALLVARVKSMLACRMQPDDFARVRCNTHLLL